MLGSLLSNKISEPCSPKDQTSSEDLVSYFQRLTAIMWEPNKPNLHLMISPSIPQCLPSWRRFNFIISQTVLICYTGGLRAWGAKKRHLRLKAPLWLPAEREDHWRSTVWPTGESAQETQEMHRESWADKYTFYYCYFIASCIQKRIKRYDFLKNYPVFVSSPFASVHLWWKYQPWYVELKLELIESESSRCSIEC